MALDLLETGSGAVRELFMIASEIVGRDMWTLIRDSGGETLKRGDIAQPAITLANLAAAAFLRERGIVPLACAGFSLGEYAALACAGVIDAENALRLVLRRGRAMQEVSDRLEKSGGGAAGMAAVTGLSPETVESLIARWTAEGLPGLYGANYNSPKQVVVSGTAAALEAAESRVKEAGARRVIRLQVAGPFHSPLMADAAAAFAPALEAVKFADPVITLYSNVTGEEIRSGEEAKRLALDQITSPVRWTREEAALDKRGDLEAAVETGPGKVLQGLWKDSGSPLPCFGAGTLADMNALTGANSTKA
jgi:[acyl-carrier-protein] S-malonyltransferase